MRKIFSNTFTLLIALLIFNFSSNNIYAANEKKVEVILQPVDSSVFYQPNDSDSEIIIEEISENNSANNKTNKTSKRKNKTKKNSSFSKLMNGSKGANVVIQRIDDDEESTESSEALTNNNTQKQEDSTTSKSNKKKTVSNTVKEKVTKNYIKSNIANKPKKNKKSYIQEKIFLPGHETKEMVCQGIAYLPNKVMNANKQSDGSYCRYVLLSYYPKNSSQPSQIVAVDKEKGKAVRRFALYNSKNSKYDGHCGGIAVAGKYLWVASSYKIRAFDLQTIIDFILDKNAKSDPAKGLPDSLDKLPVKKLVAEKKYGVDSIASYLSFDGKYLWVGDFSEPGSSKYKPISHHNVMGRKNWLAGYLVNENGYPTSKTKYSFSKHSVHKPDAIIAMRQEVQGMAVCGNYIALSLSFGAKNSKLAFYKNPLNSKGETVTYKAGGEKHSVKGWELSGKKNHVKTIKLPAGSEDLEYDGENLYVTFECNSKNFRSRWGSKKGVKITENFYLIDPKIAIKKK